MMPTDSNNRKFRLIARAASVGVIFMLSACVDQVDVSRRAVSFMDEHCDHSTYEYSFEHSGGKIKLSLSCEEKK